MINGDYIQVKAPDDFPGKKYDGKYCLEHHLVYWKHTGKVPSSSQIIHHRNGNKHDNRFENLTLLSNKEHVKYHNKMRGRTYLGLTCPVCHKYFVRRKIRPLLINTQNILAVQSDALES